VDVLFIGYCPRPLSESGKSMLWLWRREARSDCWKGRILGVAFLFWNSCLTSVENWSRPSTAMSGMSSVRI